MSKTDKKPEISLKDKIAKNNAIVLFYASWCPFSQRILPVFEEYAKSNPQECISLMMDDKEDLCDEFSIEYYPTVISFKKGKIQKRLDSEHGIGFTEKQLKNS